MNKLHFKNRYGWGDSRKGLTLVELLVVLGIILLLAQVALPGLLTMRTRGMVVAAHANVERLCHGLVLYAFDNRHFPETQPRMPEDPLGLLSDNQLEGLLHPFSYTTTEAMHDPFGTVESWGSQQESSNGNDFPKLKQPNPQRSLLYFDYPSLAKRVRIPAIRMAGASVVSIGPDRLDSLGVYRPFDERFLLQHFPSRGVRHPYDTVYNPTNGSTSFGDIVGFVGDARRFARP